MNHAIIVFALLVILTGTLASIAYYCLKFGFEAFSSHASGHYSHGGYFVSVVLMVVGVAAGYCAIVFISGSYPFELPLGSNTVISTWCGAIECTLVWISLHVWEHFKRKRAWKKMINDPLSFEL